VNQINAPTSARVMPGARGTATARFDVEHLAQLRLC